MMPLTNEIPTGLHIYAELPGLLEERKDIALATIVGVKGSAPQKPGISAVFDKHGLVAGTIGGGIVEYSVRQLAMDSFAANRSGLHRFSLNHDVSENEGAVCGGEMSIFLEIGPGRHQEVFNSIKESLENRVAGVLLTSVVSDDTKIVNIGRRWITRFTPDKDAFSMEPSVVRQVGDMLDNPVMGEFRMEEFTVSASNKRLTVYMETVMPPSRLVIAGAGHVGRALAHLGRLLNFEVIVWDYRNDYSKSDNLPDAHILLSGTIRDSLASIPVDRNTYVVAVTTGHNKDAEVLKTFIGSGAGYIGMIGSRKKAVLMQEKFLKEGWATPEQWEKIHTPVGLPINAETVEEIAVSIAAQLIQVRHLNNKKS